MKKILVCLLFALTLLFSAESEAYAADEELKYSEFVDEVAGMIEPQWTIHFNPKFKYKQEFWIFGFGRTDEYKSWDIVDFYYSFNLENKHEGIANVGYMLSDLGIMFEFEYSAMEVSGELCSDSAIFYYDLSEYYSDSADVSISFPYDEILSGCDYYSADCPVLIDSVKITIYSKVLNRCGTSIIYEFSYADDAFNKQICSEILCYKYNPMLGLAFIGDGVDTYREEETFEYFMYTLVPGSDVDLFVGLLHLLGDFIVNFPKMVWSVITFLIDMFQMLPAIIHSLVPFLPETIISAIMFCISFGFLWGIVSLFRKLKG